jgi:hypothetical protein
MQAEANAATDSKWQALPHLRVAERDLERADSLPEAEWTGNYRRESLAHQTGLTLVCLRDLRGAEQHFADSVGGRRSVERRTRTLIGARLAHVQARHGHLERAAQTVLNMRSDLAVVSSARVTRELSAIRQTWRTARTHSQIAEADTVLAEALCRP